MAIISGFESSLSHQSSVSELNFRFKKMLLVTVTSDVCNAVTVVIEGGESLFFLSFNILFTGSMYLNIVN